MFVRVSVVSRPRLLAAPAVWLRWNCDWLRNPKFELSVGR